MTAAPSEALAVRIPEGLDRDRLTIEALFVSIHGGRRLDRLGTRDEKEWLSEHRKRYQCCAGKDAACRTSPSVSPRSLVRSPTVPGQHDAAHGQ
jgi:hypothetical protein